MREKNKLVQNLVIARISPTHHGDQTNGQAIEARSAEIVERCTQTRSSRVPSLLSITRKRTKGPGASGEEGMTSDTATAATGDIARKRSGANDEVIRGEDVDALAIDKRSVLCPHDDLTRMQTLDQNDQTTSAPPPPQLKTVLLRKTAPRDEEKRPQTRR